MPIEAAGPARRQARGVPDGWRIDIGRLTNRIFAVAVFCGCIAIVEPSPYDFVTLIALGVWALGGFRIHPLGLVFAGLIFVYNLGGFIALLPYLDESLPATFMLQSLYLAVTAVFFALFFAEDTERRAALCLKAFGYSALLASICGILGYFDILGTGALFSLNGRAAGTFKDPNVLGSYVILGALYYLQNLLLGRTRHVGVTTLALVITVMGVFLSFSRGSWLAFVLAGGLTTAFAVITAPTLAQRRRAGVLAVGVAAATVLVIGILLSFGPVRDLFLQRFALMQDYDSGETGRFGAQLRGLGMLLDRLNGFGPLRWRLLFELDPHNSYINAFASYGWFGACGFFLLVGLTTFIGFRLAIVPSPYRRVAQVFWPALFVFLIQGLQIDIDHWRHVYLMLGAVWGLETARLRWREGRRRPGTDAAQAACAAVTGLGSAAALASVPR